MYKQIQSHLKVLIEKPLFNIGRASNLIWFNFGERIIKKNRLGKEKIVWEFTLHVQCSWRFTNDKEILVTYRDIYILNSQWKDIGEFNWETQGINRFDEKVNEINNNIMVNLIVTQISADNLGGVRIYFENDCVLELFPDESKSDVELWRFITNVDNLPHIVITGNGIEI